MNLSPHFTLAELVASARARALGIDNTPPAAVVEQLQTTAAMLEQIRALLGRPVNVTSGFRCSALNRAVGGVTSSDHLTGQAADIQCPAFGSAEAVARAVLPLVGRGVIGQLILEGVRGRQWVHVSTRVPSNPANRVLTITEHGTRAGIQEL